MAKKSKSYILKLESEKVLDCLDFDILVVNKGFKILFANKAFLDKIKMQRKAVIGKYCYKITHHLNKPCKPPHDPCPITKVIATSKPAVELHTHWDKDNKLFFVNVTAAKINIGQKEIGFLHIALPVKNKEFASENTKIALQKTTEILEVIVLYQQQMEEIKQKTKVLEQTKKQLETKIGDLEKFHELTVGRELRMIELKKEIEKLKTKC